MVFTIQNQVCTMSFAPHPPIKRGCGARDYTTRYYTLILSVRVCHVLSEFCEEFWLLDMAGWQRKRFATTNAGGKIMPLKVGVSSFNKPRYHCWLLNPGEAVGVRARARAGSSASLLG